MAKTIPEIKEELMKVTDLESSYLEELLEDKRVGVHKMVFHRQKELLALRTEEARLERLLYFEQSLYEEGKFLIAGIDEVGRGPLAGPVIAAAVILPVNCKINHLNDSKQIPKKHHQEIYEDIRKQALGIGIGSCSSEEIDKINIYQATRKAMLEAVKKLEIVPEHLLIDAMRIDSGIPQTSLIKGDTKSMSIAAASIVAKVTRDRLMKKYALKYPGYDFEHNVGYGTANHLAGLKEYGPCPIHRKSFEPVKSVQ